MDRVASALEGDVQASVESPCLEVFKTMWKWQMRTWVSGEQGDGGRWLDLMVLEDTSNPNLSVILNFIEQSFGMRARLWNEYKVLKTPQYYQY